MREMGGPTSDAAGGAAACAGAAAAGGAADERVATSLSSREGDAVSEMRERVLTCWAARVPIATPACVLLARPSSWRVSKC